MDISKLSLSELKTLLEMIPAEIKRREKEEKAGIRKALEALAAQSGYTLDELLGDTTDRSRKPSKVVAVKYRHPANNSLAWTGRGRQPKWVVEYLASGGTFEQLAV
jgi:DNA-binding protein H-NS